jgi:hypothetical protein
MAHRQRWSLVGVVAEVTIRTSQGQFWLRPDPACNEIVEGVLGKALKKYPGVRLHAYDAQSNHLHYAVSTVEPGQLAPFKDFVHGNLARKVNRLRGRHGAFWSRRGAEIAIVDDDAQIARLRYILAQGPAAGLVASPTSWPGASSTSALLGNMRVSATYVSQDARRRNAKRKHPLPEAELAEDVSFELTPLPVWATSRPNSTAARSPGWLRTVERAHETAAGARCLRRAGAASGRGARGVPAQPHAPVPRQLRGQPPTLSRRRIVGSERQPRGRALRPVEPGRHPRRAPVPVPAGQLHPLRCPRRGPEGLRAAVANRSVRR